MKRAACDSKRGIRAAVTATVAAVAAIAATEIPHRLRERARVISKISFAFAVFHFHAIV